MVNNERTAPPTDTPPGGEREGPHTPDCWRSHHACAVAKIEREQKGEPVAWQVRFRYTAGWSEWGQVGDSVPPSKHRALAAQILADRPNGNCEIRPLYTHPAPREVSEAMVEDSIALGHIEFAVKQGMSDTTIANTARRVFEKRAEGVGRG